MNKTEIKAFATAQNMSIEDVTTLVNSGETADSIIAMNQANDDVDVPTTGIDYSKHNQLLQGRRIIELYRVNAKELAFKTAESNKQRLDELGMSGYHIYSWFNGTDTVQFSSNNRRFNELFKTPEGTCELYSCLLVAGAREDGKGLTYTVVNPMSKAENREFSAEDRQQERHDKEMSLIEARAYSMSKTTYSENAGLGANDDLLNQIAGASTGTKR